jgi:hypothetical protein
MQTHDRFVLFDQTRDLGPHPQFECRVLRMVSPPRIETQETIALLALDEEGIVRTRRGSHQERARTVRAGGQAARRALAKPGGILHGFALFGQDRGDLRHHCIAALIGFKVRHRRHARTAAEQGRVKDDRDP